jgi:density-regulated protein DRP1
MAEVQSSLESVKVIYCAKCGMPPEYCEYGPDFERVCLPWQKKKVPELYAKLRALRGEDKQLKGDGDEEEGDDDNVADSKPDAPWTTEERLTKFYEMYVPEKVDDVPSLLEKYAGKEDKLFMALAKKYGSEPEDPFYMDDDDEDDDDDDDDDDELAEGMDNLEVGGKKRRGVKAKKSVKSETRVLIQKVVRQRKKATTVVVGMDTVEGVKLKDVAKAFSKKFAGSSTVKKGVNGEEIIIQGDHMEDCAQMIVSTFKVEGSCVFLDFNGEFVPFK